MMAVFKNHRFWIAGGITFGLLYVWLPLLASNNRVPAASEAEIPTVTYLCQESKEIFKLKAQPLPVKHPVTGKETLWPAMYCPQCREWKAVPGVPIGGAAPHCPTHHVPMQRTAPKL